MNIALREWRDAQRQLEPLEQRLRVLTERGAEILDRWIGVDERHVQAIAEVEARLREFRETESRLQQEALDRLRAFERTLQQEWQGARDMHEAPLRQVREQALALAETCRATADLSLRSYERTEARLAALEVTLRADVSALTREVRSALELVRSGGAAALPPAAPFPLDSVMRIHEEMRDADRAVGTSAPSGDVAAGLRALVPLPASERGVEPRVMPRAEESQPTVAPAAIEVPASSPDRRLLFTAIGALLLVVLAGAWAFRHVTARLDEAATRAAAAEQAAVAADSQRASANAEASRQAAAAQQAVARAALLSDVLAAPDLVRFALVGVNGVEGASGQVMWSRSRGLAVSVSDLRTPPGGARYQAWLLSSQDPINAGILTPDAGGRATLVTENPPNLPRPITGLHVTLQPAGAPTDGPGDTIVMIRPAPLQP